MLNDYTVNITIRNKDMESVSERNYSFASYCQEQKCNLARVINDVEHAFTDLCGKSKDQWDEETARKFYGIRRNLLNAANNIERLPGNMRYRGTRLDSMPAGEFVAGILNSKIK